MTEVVKVFAEGRPRVDVPGMQAMIDYPNDIAYRKQVFPGEVFGHPAKAQLYMLEDIVDFVSKPGDTILDPFAGTGSILVATPRGRNVVMLELEDKFKALIDEGTEMFRRRGPMPGRQMGTTLLIQGDNRQILPIPVDHAITSPPYSNILQSTGMNVGKGNSDVAMSDYAGETAHPLNLGRLSLFNYSVNMRRVYDLLGKSVRPGGTLTVIIKDRISGGQREFLSTPCIESCGKSGFKLWEWHKWKTPGTAQQKLMRARGWDTVWDEDILIFRKGE